jgi:ABC-2 type transport system permease protein
MSALRMLGIGVWLHVKQMTRSPVEIVTALVTPLVQACLAVYLFQAASEPHRLVEAAFGAGLMGVWSSVLYGSGGAVQNQRWHGTLELLVLSPRRPVMVFLPITLATAVVGAYAILATLFWGVVGFRIPFDVARPGALVLAVVATVCGLGMLGLLLASTFVLMPNANALSNTLEYPIWLLSGVLVSVTVLPGWTGPLAVVLPTTWGARAVREAITGNGAVWPSVAYCLGIGLVCLVAGAFSLSVMQRRARAAATLALT